jgi:biotin-[acetyl-CoA-carboxylase] ligase BirA-like protein
VLGGALLFYGEGEGGPGGQFAVDLRGRLPFSDRAANALDVAGQLQLVARYDDALEANPVDPGEERHLAAVLLLGEHSHGTGLRHRLDDQDAGHDRTAREVTGEVPLVRTHAFSRDHPLAGSKVDDLVEEEEWIAVRQDRLDLFTRQSGQPRESSLSILPDDSLAPDIVEPLLRGRFGRPYLYFERCESTQHELAPDAPEGAVAAAEEQTAGRGRLGRPWYAPPRASLLASINLRPQVEIPRLPELSLVAGLAVADAIEEATAIRPEVQFPNDVLIGGRKVAGILAEARDERVVLGIGINANLTEDELPEAADTPPTSLQIETGAVVDRVRLLVALLERLEVRYDAWVSGAARSG